MNAPPREETLEAAAPDLAQPLPPPGAGEDFAPPAAPPRAAPRWERLERAGDRLNPVLVREVRQALRSRFFTVLYGAALSCAAMFGGGALLIANGSGDVGESVSIVLYFCLVAAGVGLLPLQTLLSAGTSRVQMEELQLTGLSPWSVAWGHLLASWTQLGLLIAAFLPFFALAFLLPGTDPLALPAALGIAVAAGVATGPVVLSAAWRGAEGPLWRLWQGLIGVGALGLAGMIFTVGGQLLERSNPVYDDEFWVLILGFALLATAVGSLFLCGAVARLDSDTENRSTPARKALLGAFAASAGYAFVLDETIGRERGDTALGVAAITLAAVSPWLISIVTEPGELPRGVRPRPGLRGLLAAPLLPGGGRGALLLLLAIPAWLGALSLSAADNHASALWTLGAYTLFYLLLPSAVLRRWGPIVSGAGIPLLMVATMVLPGLIGLVLDDLTWWSMEHPGNLIWVLDQVVNGRFSELLWPLTLLLSAAAVSLPRVWAGVKEAQGRR